MSKKDIDLLYEDLSDAIMELYKVDKATAYNAIKMSDMDSIIEKIGYFIYHDAIEIWAHSVWSCYNRNVGIPFC